MVLPLIAGQPSLEERIDRLGELLVEAPLVLVVVAAATVKEISDWLTVPRSTEGVPSTMPGSGANAMAVATELDQEASPLFSARYQ